MFLYKNILVAEEQNKMFYHFLRLIVKEHVGLFALKFEVTHEKFILITYAQNPLLTPMLTYVSIGVMRNPEGVQRWQVFL